ncbi:RNA polymerase sigma factor [Sandaracinobacteroides sp. A072]|uniref:RNA polymerase sigma factor n=1 Tax=Sandaracinobacteroides sp. A072 TaxID=3461146 RepID=UPI004041B44F
MHALNPSGAPGASHVAADRRIAAEPEALLAVRAGSGDAQAFRDLARLVARPALGLAIRILGDHAAAEDAVQDALSKLWREAHRFDPSRGSFGGWWRSMLVNSALDSRRRLRPALSRTESLDTAIGLADGAPSPADAAQSAEIAARVQAATESLPPRQRAALSLFHGDGFRMAEIAAMLETSEKAVEGLLLRARATLRTQLLDLKDELE